MWKEGICPYYRYEKKGFLYCEACRFRTDNRRFRAKIVYGYCGHPKNYVNCMIYKTLTAAEAEKGKTNEVEKNAKQ